MATVPTSQSPLPAVAQAPAGQQLLLYGVDWQTYSRLLRAFASRPSVRMTYDRGVLEIMSPSLKHDTDGEFIGRLIVTLTEELGLPVKSGGSVTLRRRKLRRGLEADRCYWIANEARMRGKEHFDARVDPAPDLALEIDVTSSSLKRMDIYAALKVPEVWRSDKRALSFHALGTNGKYNQVADSRSFPGLLPTDLVRFLDVRAHMDENAVIREFREWVRQRVAIGWQ